MYPYESQLEAASPTENERLWAAGAHLGAMLLAAITTWFAGIAGVAGAGGIWMLKRDESTFIAEHAIEALNFNLSMFIYTCVAFIVGVLLVGMTVLTLGLGLILTAPAGILLVIAGAAIAVLWLVCSVIATVKAYNGERYRYPLTLRLIK